MEMIMKELEKKSVSELKCIGFDMLVFIDQKQNEISHLQQNLNLVTAVIAKKQPKSPKAKKNNKTKVKSEAIEKNVTNG